MWFEDHGLSAAQIGQVLGLAALLRVLAVPGWGWITDRVGRPRAGLGVAALAAAAATVALPATRDFGAVLLVAAVQGVAAAALVPLADTIAIALSRVRRIEYGRARAWGSVTYMVASAAGGAVLARTGTWVVPWAIAAAYAAAAATVPLLPRVATAPAGPRGGGGLLGARAFWLSVLAGALIQGSHAAYYAFAALHWRAAGIGDATIGLLIGEAIVAEVALFVWGRALVERIGPARLTALAAVCCLLRWTGTAFVTDVPALAALQVLHAGTFAFQHLSSMLVLRAMPPGRAATAQALHAALGSSAPTGVLIWLSGRLYAGSGGGVFLVMAAVGGSALLLAPALGRAVRANAPGP